MLVVGMDAMGELVALIDLLGVRFTGWPHTSKTWKSQGIWHRSGKSPGNCGFPVVC